MRHTAVALVLLPILSSGCGSSRPSGDTYAIHSGTYAISDVREIAAGTDTCGLLAAWSAPDREIRIIVDGDGTGYEKGAVAFDLDGNSDASTWPTGVFHWDNMGTSTNGTYTLASNGCVVRAHRSMAADLIADDALDAQLGVTMVEDETSTRACTIADLPDGATAFPCSAGVQFRAERR